MSERDRVIDAFRNCITVPKCRDCPWVECSTLDNGCVEIPRDLALAVMRMLAERYPHVIRFDEIDNYEVLWLEVRDVNDEEGLAPWVKTMSGHWFSPLLCSTLQPDMILSTPEEYGTICRCWTARPTEEMRKAAAWNDH